MTYGAAVAGLFQQLDQDLHRQNAGVTDGLADGGERRVGLRRERQIVESDQRHIASNPQPGLLIAWMAP